MMIRKYLPVMMACLLSMPALAQEGQSLGDLARKIRDQKEANQRLPAPGPVATPPVVAADAKIKPDLHPDFINDLHAADRYEAAIRELALQEKFEALDQIANEARSTRATFPGSFWKIHLIYAALKEPAGGMQASEADWTQQLGHLQHWKEQKPDSITARVALAWFYNSYGWKARGTGYADSVTQEGWGLLEERAHMARKILEEASTLPAKCPEWFLAMLAVARSEGWESAETNALFEKAAAFDSDYYYYHRTQADSLLPKWGGEEGDVAKFAWTIADRIGGKKGDLMYYQIGSFLNCACDNDRQLNQLSWPRLKQGYAALVELYGTSIFHLNKMAYMASMAGDDDYAKGLFTQIGDNWDKDTWREHDYFIYAKARVEGAPLRRAFAQAQENSRTPEGHLFDETLMASLKKNYQGKLMECMKTTPNYELPMVGLLMRLAQDGSVRQVVMAPFNAPADCFRPQLEKASFPAPPRDDYWVVANMEVKK